MFGFDRFERHAAQVGRMADTLGHDLVEATQRGEMPEAEMRSAVYRCIGCSAPGDCAAWLDAHADGAEAPPLYCRNGEMFAGLAPADSAG